MENRMLSDDELRPTVRESWPIFQASVTWCAIFMGFVFSALLLFLARPTPISFAEKAVVFFLLFALVLLRCAVISLQITAHQVISYWQFFFPSSRALTLSRLFLTVGIQCMLFAIAVLLFDKGMPILAAFVIFLGVVELGYQVLRIRSQRKAPNIRAVDQPKKPVEAQCGVGTAAQSKIVASVPCESAEVVGRA
jgi:hypothetical protein